VAREFSQQYGVTLVLKGFQTLIASPDGQVWVNPTGNPGMATGGTGDVLTGLTAGLLAQFPSHPVGEVATAAVYLHGLAGDLAAEELGQPSMLAGDLLEKIPRAYKMLTEGN
jgi:NAD(P)H-hydrate epimerase